MKKALSFILTLFTYALALLFFFPILWMIITGFKLEGDAVKMPPSLIFTPTLENYQQIWDSGVVLYLKNSAMISLTSTLLALILGVPAAYALAMFKMKKGDDILFWFISTKMLPAVGVIVPVYLVFKYLNLLDTPISLIILYTAMNVPLVVWMMRSFFKDIPYELIEAYQVDGATGWQGFFKVTLPLVRPGIISTSLLCLVFAWNEFFFGVTLTYTHAATMPIFMASFMTQEGLFWAKMSAVATLAILPALILGWFTQKQLVRGLTMGAVKG
ncbi:sugar ABC transporter permease [Collibacillus ludicampi]|jgi:sorbitol/mannitol transport system permease protein|uniref:Sugar ABC transporter permease n=1 Tax=Collibacillus ludicampi TaxID=2771369 RepID=A0AAV4LFY0_9BACL|nr:carbohydrate ABC transporter permease [Collibacillus ludicampi]GIM46724.1 sugar ABC transporter permease [Collibacillus ludicampi]